MIKKMFYLIFLTIILFISFMNIVNAEVPLGPGFIAASGNTIGTVGGVIVGGGDASGPYKSTYDIYVPGVGIQTATIVASNCSIVGSTCSPQYGIYSREFGAGWQVYNMNNESIIENNTNFTTPIIAGTHLGANLYEYKTYTWWAAGIEITTIRCEVHYTYKNCSYSCDENNVCQETCTDVPYIYTYYTSGSGWSQSCQDQANRMAYNNAKKELEKDGESYTVSITDPNDARCNYPEKYADQLSRENIVCNNYDVTSTSSSITSFEESLKNGGQVTKYYYYEMYGACINAKTGKVRYINKDEKCNADEYFIENDYMDDLSKKHWHIFVPTNTKESEGYTLTFNSNIKTIMDGSLCQNVVEKYAENYEYTLYIKPLTGTFTNNIAVDKQKVTNGCYTKLVLNIPITQKYYNEEKNGSESTLQGFNFYYRPIDIDNPFPNGIASDSYWKIWEENGKKDPDISKSYDEYTYVTNMDEDEIREYNDEIEYTDWSNMNIDGSSQFIQSSQTIIRNGKITNDSFYSLGCGPQNQCEYLDSDHTVENPIYQPECSIIRLGDVCP